MSKEDLKAEIVYQTNFVKLVEGRINSGLLRGLQLKREEERLADALCRIEILKSI